MKDNVQIKEQEEFYDRLWHERLTSRKRTWLGKIYHFDEKSRLNMLGREVDKFIDPFGKGVKSFDLGCGRGIVSSLLLQKGLQVTALDLSPAAIELNKKRMPEAEFIASDIFSYDNYDFGKYDLLVSSEVMEHLQVERRKDYVDIIFRLLKDGGMAIITTPNATEMNRLGMVKDQPLDFWMTMEEFKACFESKFLLHSFQTTCLCFKNRFLNYFWKLVPFVNNIADRFIASSERGKYQMIVVEKKTSI
ncbi:MAG: class I SAM-dependent methyltransferase [Deltaproteobacteria bacterium]|nr:class I SAM-dependent methyltransferase [Deltaproteobacteria bacterium]